LIGISRTDIIHTNSKEDLMQPIISITDMTKHYPMGGGKFTALKNINLEFHKGEFAGLIGPSGSGKTTLLNILGTLDFQSEGEVEVLGRATLKLSNRQAADMRSKYMGFIFQTYNLLPHYTVFENVEFPLILLKQSSSKRKKSVNNILDWIGLSDKINSKPAQLSGGQCQRVAIARAMVKKPVLVLADEPTANLDADNSHNILQLMERMNQELETSFIFCTHDEKVIKYLHRKINLFDGKVASDESN